MLQRSLIWGHKRKGRGDLNGAPRAIRLGKAISINYGNGCRSQVRPIFILFCGLNDIGYFCNICFWGPPLPSHTSLGILPLSFMSRACWETDGVPLCYRADHDVELKPSFRVCSRVALDKLLDGTTRSPACLLDAHACHARQRQEVNFL